MGCKNSTGGRKEQIDILIEICESWGYENRVKYVTDFIIRPLKEEGLAIKYTFKPMNGGKGEFYLFKTLSDGKKTIVFSNKKDIHPDAVSHAMNISLKNSQIIIDDLKSTIGK